MHSVAHFLGLMVKERPIGCWVKLTGEQFTQSITRIQVLNYCFFFNTLTEVELVYNKLHTSEV